ncbi:MAG: acyl-CoA dehydratase activase [Thiomicrorhabdus sp.]|jgi:predicted CoA-substrate-specific enzyme activase|nr:acyl-CoA dehydratase activase [Thiomicrorhabdus sp.]
MEIAALGIDVGSTTVKMVGVNPAGEMIWNHLEPVNPRVEKQVDAFLNKLKEEIDTLENIPLIATGYGRNLVRQAIKNVTEITCHAKGVYHQLGHGGTLVDIGGQDSKVIVIGDRGQVVDFAMNDKCAAGTGRFLENSAARMQVSIDEMGSVALSATEEVTISSTCTVFAESEIISMVAHGIEVEPILMGLHRSLIKRVVAMVHSVGLVPPLLLSGGVAKNPAIRKVIEEETKEPVLMPEHPQLMGAYGAALLALKVKL